jgi:hypothetical protein
MVSFKHVCLFIEDFAPHLIITALLILNLSLALLSAKRKGSLAKLKRWFIYGPMTAFPLLIVAAGFLLEGLPYDASRSSLTPRALPIYGLFVGNILYSVWLAYSSNSARWFVTSVCLIYLWISLLCMAFASLEVLNNVFI